MKIDESVIDKVLDNKAALPNRNFLRTIHKAKNTKTIFCLMDSIEISILP